jgi:tellurite resistance protein
MHIRTRTIERLRDALLASGRRQSDVVSSAHATLARQGLLTEQEKDAIRRIDAVAEVMFLVMAADEQITDTEYAAVRGAIRGLTGQALGDGIIDVLVEDYALRLRDQGREARLKQVASTMTDEAEIESAFAMAAAVALADDEVADSENKVLDDLALWFGIGPARVRILLDQLADDAII